MLPKRVLGSTNLAVGILGLGTVKWGRNLAVKYPSAFTLPDDQTLIHLLSLAESLGINFLDTAPSYGVSEERIGQLLHKNKKRHDWIIASKVGEQFNNGKSTFDFSKEAIFASIQQSLKRMRTDYLDVVLVHSNGDDVALIEHLGVFEPLEQAKQQGLIRAYGMSCKTLAGARLTLQLADLAMLTCYPGYHEEEPAIQEAEALKKGVLIKKALASGHLATKADNREVIRESFKLNLQYASVAAIVIGTIQPAHLLQNTEIAKEIAT